LYSAKNQKNIRGVNLFDRKKDTKPTLLERTKKAKEFEMLVLSRKKDESILLQVPGQPDIKITVVRVDNLNKVRLGIEADKEITVLRSELLDKEPSIKVAAL
jgi:carbon storage regulator CsrA